MAVHDTRMSQIALSVIMVDGGFRERFWMLESWLQQTLDRSRYEILWVEYTNQIAHEVANMQNIRSIALGRHEPQQILAYAFNEGIRQAQGDIVVFPDGDVCCEPDLLETLLHDLAEDPCMVEYVLRLDQPKKDFLPQQNLAYLKQTCDVKHTFNFGGCTAVRKEWLVRMNGYEQLPFFCGYHYNGGDNNIRFKNMGLKIRWHPTQRVYHPWHSCPPPDKFSTVQLQQNFIARRAATWDWLAYDGLDPTHNRSYVEHASFPTRWDFVMTEKGRLERTGKSATSILHQS